MVDYEARREREHRFNMIYKIGHKKATSLSKERKKPKYAANSSVEKMDK